MEACTMYEACCCCLWWMMTELALNRDERSQRTENKKSGTRGTRKTGLRPARRGRQWSSFAGARMLTTEIIEGSLRVQMDLRFGSCRDQKRDLYIAGGSSFGPKLGTQVANSILRIGSESYGPSPKDRNPPPYVIPATIKIANPKKDHRTTLS